MLCLVAYWLNRNGQPEGPYEDQQLLYMIQSGQVRGGHIAQDGSNAWMPMEQHPTFGSALHAAAHGYAQGAHGHVQAAHGHVQGAQWAPMPAAPPQKSPLVPLLIVGGLVGVLGLGALGAFFLLRGSEAETSDDASSAAATAEPKKLDTGTLGFLLGRKYAFACVFTLLDKSDAAAKNIAISEAAAKELGITPPSTPSKDGAMAAMRSSSVADEISGKHDAKTAAAYSLGVAATDLYFGVMLGSDVSSQLGDAEKHARAVGIPEEAWKSKLEAARTTASEDTINALTAAFDAHFGYDK